MANEKPGFGQKLNSIQNYGGFFGWAWGIATSYWPVTTSLITGGVMTILSALSERVDAWGYVGWGAVGIVTALIVYLALTFGYSAWARGSERRARAILAEMSALRPPVVNPLDTNFHKVKVNLAETFYHPLNDEHRSKTFTECELWGPAVVFLLGTAQISNNLFVGCDFVEMDAPPKLRVVNNAIYLRDPIISRSTVYRTTFLMLPNGADAIRAGNPDGINWLTPRREPIPPVSTPSIQSP